MIHQKLPTSPTERIEIIDVVRGFAVFGILLSNILIFSGFLFTPFSDLSLFHFAKFNEFLYFISKTLISGKFYPIFCILFGYGFYMQVAKYNGKGKSFISYFTRRLFILLLIGILHQMIWPGDVVTMYALIGFLFLLVRNTSYKQDLFLAIAFFCIYLVIGLFAKIPLYQIYLIAIAILVAETVFCKLWLKRYRFGPIEWIWRCLSYRKRIPLKHHI